MEEETKKQFDEQRELLEAIYVSSEKTRRYFLWTLIVSLLVFVLPLLALLFIVPRFLSLYTSGLEGL